MKWIQPARVHRAVFALHEWRQDAQSQGSMHVLQLLVLLAKRAGVTAEVRVEEQDDFDFWDAYFRLPGDAENPYFDPLTRKRRIASHPHSNVATARKGTFAASWHAADREEKKGQTWWKLAVDWAEIFENRALRKGGSTARIPVVDLAAILFRGETWDDDASAAALEHRFRERFPTQDRDYERLFVFRDEEPSELFTDSPPPDHAYDSEITRALLPLEVDLPAASIPVPEIAAELPDDDLVLEEVQSLLTLNSAGIILRGAPGTGKSWYAQRLARRLVSNQAEDIFHVQFHPSYGYEDFVQGYAPDPGASSGFRVVDKTFLRACRRAAADPGRRVVIIIDEINRGDPARIFGEVLTFVEYRDRRFTLPYNGEEFAIPRNILLLATMNPFDRSIAQLDAAFIRRFDHIALGPSAERLGEFLLKSDGFTQDQITAVQQWFERVQALLPIGLGHTFFKDARSPEELRLIWQYRIWPSCEALLEFDPRNKARVRESFDHLYAQLTGTAAAGKE